MRRALCADSVARKFIIFCVVHKLPQQYPELPTECVCRIIVSVRSKSQSQQQQQHPLVRSTYFFRLVGKFGVLEVAIASPVQCSSARLEFDRSGSSGVQCEELVNRLAKIVLKHKDQ